jgi:ADP-heptose:LPS heptosyltransferase
MPYHVKPKQKILVIRNDKLGDFMLAWPALALLRKNLPKACIAVLVPSYTEPMAEVCSYIDEVIIDPKLKGDVRNGLALAKLLKPKKFDAVITLFSRFDAGLGVWLAGIPQRYAPATKLAQVFYNHRILQHRSLSEKPEYEYNLDIVRRFLRDQGIGKPKAMKPPYLIFKAKTIAALEKKFRKTHKIAAKKKLVFLHAGHGGSAANLSLGQYARLIHKLASNKKSHFVLTAGPGEEDQAERLANLLLKEPYTIYISNKGLLDFARHLQFCDVFISGSTGPLHLAGALNCCTAAFYPRKRSSTALRWQTVNAADRRLAFEPLAGSDDSDMQPIDVASAAARIDKKYL